MIRFYTIAIVFLLVGCASTAVPVTQKFPEVPADLMQPAPDLITLPADTEKLSDLINNANVNYGFYRELRIRYEAWQQWYQEQQKNFNR